MVVGAGRRMRASGRLPLAAPILTASRFWHFSESRQGERLAAVLLPIPSRGGLAASSRGHSPQWPIEIWYGEELTQYG